MAIRLYDNYPAFEQPTVNPASGDLMIGSGSGTWTTGTPGELGIITGAWDPGLTGSLAYFTDSTTIAGLSGALPVNKGGTGATTLASAGIHTGALSANKMPYATAATVLADSGITWDNTNSRVGIGNTAPLTALFVGAGTLSPSYTGTVGAATPQVNVSATSGEASLGVIVHDGTNNRRAKLFVDQTNAEWGLHATYTAGLPPFGVYIAGNRILSGTYSSTAGARWYFGSSGSPTARVQIGDDVTQAAWTTSGIQLRADAATYTDSNTAASGTRASMVCWGIARPTFAAANTSVTYTDAATVYIANAPAAGTNITITNAWALWLDAGGFRCDGDLKHNGSNVGFFGVTLASRTSAYTQTYSTAARTNPNMTASAVATTGATTTTPYGYTTAAQADAIPVAINNLITDVTDLKKLVNSVIDDLQTYGLFQ